MSTSVGAGSLDIPDNLTIPQFFDSVHFSRPSFSNDTPCLIDEQTGTALTFTELQSRSLKLANALRLKWNTGERDVVALIGPNHVDSIVVAWAVLRLGGIIFSADPAFSTIPELVGNLKGSDADLIVVHSDFLDKVAGVAEAVGIPPHRIMILDAPNSSDGHIPYPILRDLISDFEDSHEHFIERKLADGSAMSKPAFYFISHGLSGMPKILSLSHYSIIANIVQKSAHFNASPFGTFSPGQVSLGVLPLAYLYGLSNILFSIYHGLATVVVQKFDFRSFFQTIVKYQITHLFLVPSQVVLICKNPLAKKYDMRHVRYCFLGAQAFPIELIDDLVGVLPNCTLCQVYGLSEMSTAVAITPASQRGMPNSAGVGKFLPGIEHRVIAADGKPLKPGEAGELWVSGPGRAIGYLDNKQATRQVFLDQGWVRTGDKVTVNEGGDLFLVARQKSVFKVRGFQVSGDELEVLVRNHPDVDEVCVLGVPDLYSGEVPVALVVLGDEAKQRMEKDDKEAQRITISILKLVADNKPSYKWIGGGVHFERSFPITTDGEVDRELLRQRVIETRERGSG